MTTLSIKITYDAKQDTTTEIEVRIDDVKIYSVIKPNKQTIQRVLRLTEFCKQVTANYDRRSGKELREYRRTRTAGASA